MKRFYSGNPELDVAQKVQQMVRAVTTRDGSTPTTTGCLDEVKTETDVQKAQQLWIQLNDLAVNNYIVIPLIDRHNTDAKVKALRRPQAEPVRRLQLEHRRVDQDE